MQQGVAILFPYHPKAMFALANGVKRITVDKKYISIMLLLFVIIILGIRVI